MTKHSGYGILLFLFLSVSILPATGIKTIQIDAGQLYLSENHDYPVIRIFWISERGKQFDPPGKEGLAELTWRLLVHGGNQSFPGIKFTDHLDSLGTSLDSTVDDDSAMLSLWCLEKNFLTSWNIFLSAMYNPFFDRDIFELEKSKLRASIRRRRKNPASISQLIFKRLIYGMENRKGRTVTLKSLEAIRLDDVKTFYQNQIRKAPIMLGVYGALSEKKMTALMKESFKSWKPDRSFSKTSWPDVKMSAVPGIYFLNMKNLSQAAVCMGHLGIKRSDSDQIVVDIVNFSYGAGGLNSRLAKEIRIKQGLSYYPFGAITKRKDRGIFLSIAVTKNQSVSAVLKAMRATIESMKTQPLTREELETARNSCISRMAFQFEFPSDHFSKRLLYSIKGYPPNYFDTYSKHVSAIAPPKVQSVSRRVFNTSNLVILVVGDEASIIPQLKALNWGKIVSCQLGEKEFILNFSPYK